MLETQTDSELVSQIGHEGEYGNSCAVHNLSLERLDRHIKLVISKYITIHQ